MLTYINIANIRIEIKSPFSIIVGRESQPFVDSGKKSPDCCFEYKEVKKLTDPVSEVVCSESNRLYYTYENKVYLRRSPISNPYAQVFVNSNDPFSMICEYLPGSESELIYMRNVYTAFGLESFLLRFDTLILHSSFINFCENGILFSGTTGAGKSTQASLWETHENAEVVNGDRAGLRREGSIWCAYGLPIAGSSNIYLNKKVPLRCIILPIKAKVNEVRRAAPAEAYRYLYPEVTMHRWDPEFEQKASRIMLELLSEIPVYFMQCRPDKEAVETLKKHLVMEGVIR